MELYSLICVVVNLYYWLIHTRFPSRQDECAMTYYTIMTSSVKVCIQLLLPVWLQWFEFHLWREEIAKQAVHFYADENAENRQQ